MLSNPPDLTRFQKWHFLLWIAIGLYYFRFDNNGLVLYPHAADCLLSGKPLLPCEPLFTYPPAFAFFMIPFALMPTLLKNLLWYLLSVSVLYFSFRLCEYLTLKAFGIRFDTNRLYWFRLLSLALGLKFILAVLENQAYDHLILFFILLAVYGLMEEKDLWAASGIALAAALKVTPLLFFPYLLFRKKWKVFACGIMLYLFISFLPDFFFTAGGTEGTYFGRWVQDIVQPAIMGRQGPSASGFWQGENPLNQSLRSLVFRTAVLLDLASHFKTILYFVYTSVLLSLFLFILKTSPLKNAPVLDGSALVIGMVMLSPMSSKSHFIVLLLPYMVILAYLMTRQSQSRLLEGLLLLSFIFNSLTSKGIIGRRLSTALLLMGCITIGTLLILLIVALIAIEMTRSPERDLSILPERLNP
ncbi:MAG: DUF2029 domain-containing protein [Candidatus Manganitrophaceae bacterium]|nr:MAG: DUF2029 domain-containing protein [Candidatus Manganitrophaceae bacterium]